MRVTLKLSLVVILLLPCAIYARKLKSVIQNAISKGAMAKIVLKVYDDQGMPVTNANVRATFDMPSGEYSFFGWTDTNGVWVASGKTNGNYMRFFVSKDGHYASRKEMSYIPMWAEHDVKDGKWQPYGGEQQIALRRILNPCLLVDTVKWISVPRTNEWMRFDMRIGDFVHPYGTGTGADFEVKVEWDGLSASQCRLCKATVRFVAEKSGGYFARKSEESDFPFAYRADTNKVFEVSFTTINREGDFHQTHHPFPKDEFFVTRTRCELKANGEIVSANYGMLRRFDIYPSRNSAAMIDYSGAFNPIPNDTNLEPK